MVKEATLALRLVVSEMAAVVAPIRLVRQQWGRAALEASNVIHVARSVDQRSCGWSDARGSGHAWRNSGWNGHGWSKYKWRDRGWKDF